MSSASAVAKLKEELQLQLQEYRRSALEQFSLDCLTWLALTPFWTLELCHLTGFPGSDTSNDSDTSFWARVQESGLCEARQDLTPTGKEVRIFWMPEQARREVLAEITHISTEFSLAIHIRRIADRFIHSFRENEDTRFPALIRWAEVAHMINPEPEQLTVSVSQVATKCERLLRTALDQNDIGQANEWLTTSQLLAWALSGEMALVVEHGYNWIEVKNNILRELKLLVNFLKRQEQLDEFEKLLSANKTWGLHYLGMGGVGKTMLLRYITAQATDENGNERYVTARIDFDHLNADFPLRRPAQLLVELAADLRLRIKDQAQRSALDEFYNSVRSLNERLKLQEVVAQDQRFLLSEQSEGLFQSLLNAFADVLIGFKCPVVLILDTCEELARAEADGRAPKTINATLSIMEQLHTAAPNMRVIFAGRRLLKRELENSHDTTPESERLDYEHALRRHVIKNFTQEEVEAYWTKKRHLPMDSNLLKAVMKQSLDVGVPDSVEKASTQKRYNPFMISLYANSVIEDPQLTADAIRTMSASTYIEKRLIERIKNPEVEATIPSVTLMGRFDKSLLGVAQGINGEKLETIYNLLRNLEWISVQSDEALKTEFLKIQPQIHTLLEDYYRKRKGISLIEAPRRKLTERLPDFIISRSRDQINEDHIRIAAQILPAEGFGVMWLHLERDITEKAAWDWAETVCRRVMFNEQRTKTFEPSTYSHLCLSLTYASALTHTGRRSQVTSQIGGNLRHSLDQGISSSSLFVDLRALSYLLDSQNNSFLNIFWDAFPHLQSRLNRLKPEDTSDEAWSVQQLMATCCSIMEQVIERAENDPRAVNIVNISNMIALANALIPYQSLRDVGAFMLMLAARALRIKNRPAESLALIDKAIQNASPVVTQRWLDWVLPIRLQDRLRLEAIRLVPPLQQAKYLPNHDYFKSDMLHSIDTERLASFCIIYDLEFNAPDEVYNRYRALMEKETYTVDRQSIVNAHREIVPLFVTLVRLNASVGIDSDQMLQMYSNQASRAEDASTVEWALNAQLRVIARMRLSETDDYRLAQSFASLQVYRRLPARWGRPALALAFFAPFDAFSESQDIKTDEGRRDALHHWWRSQTVIDSSIQDIDILLNAMQQVDNLSTGKTLEDLPVWLDGIEMGLILGDKAKDMSQSPFTWHFEENQLRTDNPLRFGTIYRLALRARALGLPFKERFNWQIRTEEIGPRRAAEIALEEGELLSLRLPEQGLLLIEHAKQHFEQVKDHMGAFMACICGATTAARAGHELKVIAEWLDSAAQHYETMVKLGDPDLQLPLLAVIDVPHDVGQYYNWQWVKHPFWSDWLLRFIFCRYWVKVRQKNTISSRLDNWAERLSQEIAVRHSQMLPVEFRLPESNISGYIEPNSSSLEHPLATQFGIILTLLTPTEVFSQNKDVALRIEIKGIRGNQVYEFRSKLYPDMMPNDIVLSSGSLVHELRRFLQSVDTSNQQGFLSIEFNTPSIAAFPWEAATYEQLGLFVAEAWRKIFTYRTIERPTQSDPNWLTKDWQLRNEEIRVLAEYEQMRSLSRAFKVQRVSISSLAPDDFAIYGFGTPRIIYIVASPTLTTRGVQLHFESESLKFVKKSAESRGFLLPPADILGKQRGERTSNSSLIILQLPLNEKLSHIRSSTEREQMANLKRYAAEVFAAGAYAVLTLPPLPFSLLGNILDRLEGIPQTDVFPSRETLVDVAASIRQYIYDSGPSEELAFDVCLYISSLAH